LVTRGFGIASWKEGHPGSRSVGFERIRPRRGQYERLQKGEKKEEERLKRFLISVEFFEGLEASEYSMMQRNFKAAADLSDWALHWKLDDGSAER
jgi:hypothetical protein